MRARTHEQLERKNQLLFYCSKEDVTEMLIDTETIIDVLNYKIKILEEENEILKIETRDLKEQLKDEDAYHEEANKWCIEAQKLSIRINKAIEYIEDNVAVYAFGNKELPHWEFDNNNIRDLLKILKDEE